MENVSFLGWKMATIGLRRNDVFQSQESVKMEKGILQTCEFIFLNF